jgi:hypothetical protein
MHKKDNKSKRTHVTKEHNNGDTTRIERPIIVHLREGFFAIFARGPHFLWCPKSKWSPPLCASITLKMGKNELKVRKLWPLKLGGVVFLRKINQPSHSLFLNLSRDS